MKYIVVFEKADNSFAAYVPDLPGCIGTGNTKEDVERNIREAISFHVEGLKLEQQDVPRPQAWSELVEA